MPLDPSQLDEETRRRLAELNPELAHELYPQQQQETIKYSTYWTPERLAEYVESHVEYQLASARHEYWRNQREEAETRVLEELKYKNRQPVIGPEIWVMASVSFIFLVVLAVILG